jgi:hypothetical protein
MHATGSSALWGARMGFFVASFSAIQIWLDRARINAINVNSVEKDKNLISDVLRHEFSVLLPTAGAGCAVGGIFGLSGGMNHAPPTHVQTYHVRLNKCVQDPPVSSKEALQASVSAYRLGPCNLPFPAWRRSWPNISPQPRTPVTLPHPNPSHDDVGRRSRRRSDLRNEHW